MIVSRTSPVMEDAWIDRLLVAMEALLLPVWSAATAECKFYGRVDMADDKVFFGEVDVTMDDKFKFISYVKVDADVRYDRLLRKYSSNLVCQGNLKSLYPSISHRADAELRKDVERVLMMHLEPTDYRGFTIVDQTKVKDSQPFHTVIYNFDIVI